MELALVILFIVVSTVMVRKEMKKSQ